MYLKLRRVVFVVLINLLFVIPSYADLEWSVGAAISLGDEVVDVAEAPDGKRIFALTKSGKVIVLNQQGSVESTIAGPFAADRLSVSSDGKRLFLAGKGQKQLQVVSLLDRFNIQVGQSPVKGDIAAAVTVAVFSDFQ